MERKKRTKPLKKWLIIADGALIVALMTAIVVLAVTLLSKDKPAVQQSATLSAGDTQPAPAQAAGSDSAPASADTGAAAPVVYSGDEAVPIQVDFQVLKAANSEVVGWLYQPNTSLNYAVLQNIDNDYYIGRNADGKKDKAGAVCLDSRNDSHLLDAHVVLYGNAMADGSMFGSLVGYREQSYLDAHPALFLITPGGNYRIDVFAAYTASAAMSNYPIWFMDKSARTAYLNTIKKESLIQSELKIESNAQIISLATNIAKDSDTRFVVCGVLTKV